MLTYVWRRVKYSAFAALFDCISLSPLIEFWRPASTELWWYYSRPAVVWCRKNQMRWWHFVRMMSVCEFAAAAAIVRSTAPAVRYRDENLSWTWLTIKSRRCPMALATIAKIVSVGLAKPPPLSTPSSCSGNVLQRRNRFWQPWERPAMSHWWRSAKVESSCWCKMQCLSSLSGALWRV